MDSDSDATLQDKSKQIHADDVKVQVIDEKQQLLNMDEDPLTSIQAREEDNTEEIQLKNIHPLSSNFRSTNEQFNSENANLHKIAIDGHIEMMRATLNQPEKLFPGEKQLNMQNDAGFTPLHYAVMNQHVEICVLLVDHGADINKCDMDGRTALHLALFKLDLDERSYGARDQETSNNSVLKYLLGNNASIDVKDKQDRTPFHFAALSGSVDSMKLLLEALNKSMHNEDVGSSLVKDQFNSKDCDGKTALHFAAEYRLFKMCEFLTTQGVDMNVRDIEGRTSLHYLVCRTFQKDPSIQISKQLLNEMLDAGGSIDAKDKYRETPLHLACRAGHPEVVRVLLEGKADVTLRCISGWNALDFAIESEDASCTRLIIDSENWREVLKSHSNDLLGGEAINTPIRNLIRKMPEIAEEVFTKCMKSDNSPINHVYYHVVFDYEFLDDEFSCNYWSGDNKDVEVYDAYGHIVDDVLPYSNDLNLLKENHPLNIMVQAKRKTLLRHPLVVSLLNYKWKRFVRPVYILNLLLYLTFMAFFNLYMLTMPPPYSIDSNNVTSSCVAIITEAQPKFGRCYDYNSRGIVAKYFVIVLSVVSLIKEVYQIYSQRISYFQSFTNLFEVSLYILAILTVYSDTSSAGPNYIGVRENWQWQIGAVSIFLSWMVLIMFIQNVPTFGIYVLMFTEVLQTFTKFFFVFVLFILGFAFSFHCLLQNQYAFREWWNAVIKTLLMMMGEFGFEGIFVAEVTAIETGANNHTITVSAVNYRAVSYILFVCFVIVMSIIIMNLLVGLAVDDIKGVQKNAELKSLAMKVKLILDVEYSLPQFIRRRVVPTSRCYYPNEYRQRSDFIQWLFSESNLDYSAINETINPEKNERDQLEKRVESLDQKIVNLDGKVDSLKEMIASHFNANNDDSNP
uniref:Transient receptor potential cation channel subfamily A member 1 homolog n=1 Tax=Phallusia mammillata TaxID=59560 RepID=A0A6F9DW79_9ASCI|nr:transient receptor potential cation channel subfamily A member 1 homolog [Phallusia mammillata]